MACFDTEAVIVAAHGRRIEGGTGAVESQCTGTRAGAAHPVRMMGGEVLEFRGEKITARY